MHRLRGAVVVAGAGRPGPVQAGDWQPRASRRAHLVVGFRHEPASEAILVQVCDIPGIHTDVIINMPLPVLTVLHPKGIQMKNMLMLFALR